MSRDTADTIVAVSSPPGRSLRGLIRLTGADAVAIASSLLQHEQEGNTAAVFQITRRLVPSRLKSPAIPCLVALFPGPHSYTGDDLVEIQCPGDAALLDRVMHAAIDAGARLAEPGEFTFRAFLHGRLDLTEAEGVAATIEAVSDAQLAAAGLLREGRLSQSTGQLVDRLGEALALVEAGIDFVDQDDVVPIPAGDLRDRLKQLLAELLHLLQHARSWGAIESLPRVVLVGPPSSGKSTVFNRLLGHDRAVVDALPGTTRDALSEPLQLQPPGGQGEPLEVMLVDIAGLDTAEAMLDRSAQAAAQREIAQADLLVVFGQSGLSHGYQPTLRVSPKADLHDADADGLPISGHTGQGMDELLHQIARKLSTHTGSAAGDALYLQPRHELALRQAEQAIRAGVHLLGDAEAAVPDVELVAGELRQALDDLAGLGGQMTPDDVIGKVFAAFCVGK